MTDDAGRAAVERSLARLRERGAAAGDALFGRSDAFEARVRGEEIDFVKQARSQCLGIRVFAAGESGLRCAVGSTSDLTPETVDRTVDETLALARATAEDDAAGLPGGGYATSPPDLQLEAPEDRHVAVEARIEDARRAERAARDLDPRIENSEGSQVESSHNHFVYGNSDGFLEAYRSASHSLATEPVANQGGAMQRDWAMSAARRLADLEDPATLGRRAAQRALRRLGARKVPTCTVPVLFEPRTARSLVAHVASCANGGAVYRGTSCLADKLGQRIASELITIVDDGTLPRGLGSRPFDGEGQATRRNVLVTGGELTGYLLDHYAARKLGQTATGSAQRGPASAPGPGASNVWLEPGGSSAAELVAATKRGFLVTELIGSGFDPLTGDYSRGATGFWIEGGEIAYPVEEVTIAGRLEEMLQAIDGVADDLEWTGSIGAPTLRIASMTLAGS